MGCIFCHLSYIILSSHNLYHIYYSRYIIHNILSLCFPERFQLNVKDLIYYFVFEVMQTQKQRIQRVHHIYKFFVTDVCIVIIIVIIIYSGPYDKVCVCFFSKARWKHQTLFRKYPAGSTWERFWGAAFFQLRHLRSVWLLWFGISAEVNMSAQVKVLALDEGEAEPCRERGGTHRSVWET